MWKIELAGIVDGVPKEEAAALIGELERMKAEAYARLLTVAPAPAVSGPLLTAEDVAGRLGVAKQRVWELCREDRIPHVKMGKQYRFVARKLDEWMATGGTGL